MKDKNKLGSVPTDRGFDATEMGRAYELLTWFEKEKQERLLRRGNFVPKSSLSSLGKGLNKCETAYIKGGGRLPPFINTIS